MKVSSRGHALRIFRAALGAADPVRAVLRHVRREGEALIAGGRLVGQGPLDEVLTSGAVSACFGVEVVVGRADGRFWTRAVG